MGPQQTDGTLVIDAPFEAQNTVAIEVMTPTAVEAQERAMVDMQIATARRYPRQPMSVVKQRTLGMATMDHETARACYYSLKRSGKMIEGPSVRLAEIVASQYGNLRIAARMVANDGKTVTAQGVCHDLETNVAVCTESLRRITGTDGRTYSDDMQIVTSNAAMSIARRNAVFQVVPRALVNSIWPECKRVALGEQKPIAKMREEFLAWADKNNVSKDQIIDHFRECEPLAPISAIEDMTLEHIIYLRGVAQAVKDHETTVEEQFPAVTKKPLFKKREEPKPEIEAPKESA